MHVARNIDAAAVDRTPAIGGNRKLLVTDQVQGLDSPKAWND
jgi:hypothetical protein